MGSLEARTITEAKVMANTIANAIEQYHMEYFRFPAAGSPVAGGDAESDTSRGGALAAELLGKRESGHNTRSLDFLYGCKAAKPDPDAPAGWSNGLVTEGTHIAVYDPWGGPYRARLDIGRDGSLDNPNTEQVAKGILRLRKRVILWSAGKDGKWDTWEDNVMNWE